MNQDDLVLNRRCAADTHRGADSIIGLHAQSNIVLRMIEVFEGRRADAVIAFEEVPREEVVNYGIAAPRGDAEDVFELADLVEKPTVDEARSNLAVAARYVCSPAIFELLAETEPGRGGEIQFTDALHRLIQNGGNVLGVRLGVGERRFDIGGFDSYFKAFTEFVLADARYGPSLRAHLEMLLAKRRQN